MLDTHPVGNGDTDGKIAGQNYIVHDLLKLGLQTEL